MKKIAAVTLTLILFLSINLMAQEDEKVIVENVIKDSIRWALDKNFDRLYSIMAHDANLFWFNPDDSFMLGWDKFLQESKLWADPRFKATRFETRDMRINFSRSGDVAWWSCRMDDEALWDGKPVGWINIRWTGVVEKRDGKWVIVQQHFSYPRKAGE